MNRIFDKRSFLHNSFSSVYMIFTKLGHMISNGELDLRPNDPKINRALPLLQGNHVAKFGKDHIYRTKAIMQKRPLVKYSIHRGRTLFILGSLGHRSRSPLRRIEFLTTGSFSHDNFSSV
jgi:hypothetical protein